MMLIFIYTGGGGGGAKSQYPYVGLNSSVTECPIEIILSGLTIVWIVALSQILLNCV